MDAAASQITSLTIVYSTVYSDADQRKHQSSASLAFVRGIHRWPVNSLHKWPVTRKMFSFDDVIMIHPLMHGWVMMSNHWEAMVKVTRTWVTIGSGNDLLPDSTQTYYMKLTCVSGPAAAWILHDLMPTLLRELCGKLTKFIAAPSNWGNCKILFMTSF